MCILSVIFDGRNIDWMDMIPIAIIEDAERLPLGKWGSQVERYR